MRDALNFGMIQLSVAHTNTSTTRIPNAGCAHCFEGTAAATGEGHAPDAQYMGTTHAYTTPTPAPLGR